MIEFFEKTLKMSVFEKNSIISLLELAYDLSSYYRQMEKYKN